MAGQKTISSTFVEPIPPPTPPPPDYIITGTLSPDMTGDFYEDVIYDGKPTYKRTDELAYIWWNITFLYWAISGYPGDLTNLWQHSVSPNILGTYNPVAPSTGIATVSAGA